MTGIFQIPLSAALGHIQPKKGCQAADIEICGQCAAVINPDQEFLQIVADGFPGVIHLDCYDAWFDGNIRGRYPD